MDTNDLAPTIFSDASNTAFCVIIDGKQHTLHHNITDASSILLELSAVSYGVDLLQLSARSRWFLDNQAAVRRSKEPELDLVVRTIYKKNIEKNHHIEFLFIAGKDNPADATSIFDKRASGRKSEEGRRKQEGEV